MSKRNKRLPMADDSMYGSKEDELRAEMPAEPLPTGSVRRRRFLQGLAVASGAAAVGCGSCEDDPAPEPPVTEPEPAIAPPQGEASPPARQVANDIPAQCPYCGVGCGTLIQTENGRIVGMKPDPEHPINRGLQCIKGLTSARRSTSTGSPSRSSAAT